MRNTSQVKDDEPFAVLTLRTVRRGHREKFETALHDFISDSLHTEGQLGVHVIRPPSGSDSREYGIVRRFRSRGARDNFYNSDLFKKWEETIAPMTEGGAARQELTGLEVWFTLPGKGADNQPPRWKMALVTVVGVYPTSVLVPWLLQPLVGNLHPLLQAFFIAVGIVVILTWVVMPLLVRLLERWLFPREEA